MPSLRGFLLHLGDLPRCEQPGARFAQLEQGAFAIARLEVDGPRGVGAYEAVRVLRMLFEKHPAAKNVGGDSLLRDGRTSDC